MNSIKKKHYYYNYFVSEKISSVLKEKIRTTKFDNEMQYEGIQVRLYAFIDRD